MSPLAPPKPPGQEVYKDDYYHTRKTIGNIGTYKFGLDPGGVTYASTAAASQTYTGDNLALMFGAATKSNT